jgi:hypothetical protein
MAYDSRSDAPKSPRWMTKTSKESGVSRKKTRRGDRQVARNLLRGQNFDLAAGLRSTHTSGWDTH